MAILIVPEINELAYRRKLLKNRSTMEFAGGPVSFEKEEWENFWNTNVNTDPREAYYAFIFCRGCLDFTGEVSYRKDPDSGRYLIFILVEGFRRNAGYGRSGIELLKEEAKKNGISELYAVVDRKSQAHGFFLKTGFEKVEEDEDTITYLLRT